MAKHNPDKIYKFLIKYVGEENLPISPQYFLRYRGFGRKALRIAQNKGWVNGYRRKPNSPLSARAECFLNSFGIATKAAAREGLIAGRLNKEKHRNIGLKTYKEIADWAGVQILNPWSNNPCQLVFTRPPDLMNEADPGTILNAIKATSFRQAAEMCVRMDRPLWFVFYPAIDGCRHGKVYPSGQVDPRDLKTREELASFAHVMIEDFTKAAVGVLVRNALKKYISGHFATGGRVLSKSDFPNNPK